MFSYDNIGEKTKSLAIWIFIVESIIAVIAGIALMATNEYLVLVGLLTLLLGPFLAWISSWLLYGYGQLIENSDIIAQKCLSQSAPASKPAPDRPTPKPVAQPINPAFKFQCQKCHSAVLQYPCSQCGFAPKSAPYWCGNCGQLGPYEGACPQCGSTIKAYNTAD